MREFKHTHPWTIFLYFLMVIGFTMLIMHPIHVAMAVILSQVLYACVSDRTTFVKHLLFTLLVFCIIALSNPLFVHQGVTIIFYMNGNPMTLESFYYGLGFAGMITSVMTLFQVMNKVMSSDKFIYLFAKTIPTIALMLSMTMRLIPKFQKQTGRILQTQQTLGMDVHQGSPLRRVRRVVTMFSMLTTWAFENSIDTADSMKARGYGVGHRTSFTIFKFTLRDFILIGSTLLCAMVVWWSYQSIFQHFYYYPHVTDFIFTAQAILGYISYGLLFMIPLMVELREVMIWRCVQSNI